MGRKKVKQFIAPSLKTSSNPLKNPKSQREEEVGGVKGQPGARGGDEGAEGEDKNLAERG